MEPNESLRPSTLFKKEILAQVFSCEFGEIFRKTIFTEHLPATASTHIFRKKLFLAIQIVTYNLKSSKIF